MCTRIRDEHIAQMAVCTLRTASVLSCDRIVTIAQRIRVEFRRTAPRR